MEACGVSAVAVRRSHAGLERVPDASERATQRAMLAYVAVRKTRDSALGGEGGEVPSHHQG